MRPIEETRDRWTVMQATRGRPADLRRAARIDGPSNPCVSGLRSVCWKTFLLSDDDDGDAWIETLRNGREDYSAKREAFLRYIKHPEELAALAVDPLADEPNSPWDTARQDELIRAEIQQDVQRLPDEANYHHDRIQALILDVLFIYCKSNPDRGGYRQGMHELLAPIVHVLEADGIDSEAIASSECVDETLRELVDASFIEHDAYLLFCQLMENAQAFYAVDESSGRASGPAQRREQPSSSIVERSRFIHEVCLQKVDPELASHLISVEVLPQIFLIRWIRLLFSREFPFEQFLVLWDTILAVDPSLELVDLICVAMLIRIRWQLLEADYSVCLQLLLKYPPPDDPHGPHAFVADAEYLRGHMDASGGASLIMKHTGKMPSVPKSPEVSRPSTPSFRSFSSFRQRARPAASSPLSLAGQQGGGVEALFQGAAKGAKGMIERGERLGINQAVRDAMGEIRRNMQGLNETRYSPRPSKDALNDGGAAAAAVAMAAVEKRNRQLATMLDDTVNSLKTVSASSLEDKVKSLELVEIAAAKIQFVKIYLEDPTLEVPIVPAAAAEPVDEGTVVVEKPTMADAPGKPGRPTESQEKPAATEDDKPELESTTSGTTDSKPTTPKPPAAQDATAPRPKQLETATAPRRAGQAESESNASTKAPTTDTPTGPGRSESEATTSSMPTRATLAQSSFSWMLEPEKTSATPPSSTTSPPTSSHKKRPSSSARRERNAFLFGETTTESEDKDPLHRDDIFGMEQLRKTQ